MSQKITTRMTINNFTYDVVTQGPAVGRFTDFSVDFIPEDPNAPVIVFDEGYYIEEYKCCQNACGTHSCFPDSKVEIRRDSRPIDEIMKDFAQMKTKRSRKLNKSKKLKKTIPMARSKPRILKATASRNTAKKIDDDAKSLNSNKYNRRFKKTKKPARL